MLARQRAAGAIAVEAFDREGRSIASGTLMAVDNQIDQTTGTVRLKASFANADGALLQPVRQRPPAGRHPQGHRVVPTAAIQRGPQGAFVYVVKPDKTVELRKVALGPVEGDVTAVRDGVAAGERWSSTAPTRSGRSRVEPTMRGDPPAAARGDSRRRRGEPVAAPRGERPPGARGGG